MKVVLFGATGMVGQGVLRECLLDPEVERVLSVTRRVSGKAHDKLTELVHTDFSDFSTVAETLTGYDACFFCLGVSSVGMKEADYRRVTYDFTMAAARVLCERNPGMTFVYVSGTGTDSTEQGRSMWARVKGATENSLLALPFRAAYMFRPGYIQPMHGVVSGTRWTRVAYSIAAPLYPVWKAFFGQHVTTTEQVGLAMLHVAKKGGAKRLLENRDINEIGREAASTAAG